MKYINHHGVYLLAIRMASKIRELYSGMLQVSPKCYPIPRGGVPVAYLLNSLLPNMRIVSTPEEADFFVDDLLDSGATHDRYLKAYPGKPFFVLIDKREEKYEGTWIQFPWEKTDAGEDESGTDIVVRLLQLVGEDPKREGLRETPARVVKAWRHWCSGYGKDPADIMKVFEDGAEGCDEMVVRKKIPFYSHCEHHLAPVIGECTIAYIPRGRVLGLSKLDRLVDIFARRLQVQERMTTQIADALVKHLDPIGVGVWISARHLCIESRGVQHQNSDTITMALRGAMLDNAATRAEFLSLAKD